MTDIFKPNLAGTPKNDSDIPFPVLASTKIDGLRAMIHDRVMSRSMKEIPSKHIQQALNLKELAGLDGELVVGSPTDPNCMQNSTSGVMARDKEPEFTYHVFDKFDHPGSFADRLAAATAAVKHVQAEWSRLRVQLRLDGSAWLENCPIVLVPHKWVNDIEALNTYEAECLAEGWEGVMVRRPDALYKQGRSTPREGGLLKIKRFMDAEAVIVGFEEEMKNNNAKVTNELGRSKRSSHAAGKTGKGTLGAYVCQRVIVDERGNMVLVNENTFNVGTGITDAHAAWAWANRDKLMGTHITFKSFPIGVKDAPRHPVFKAHRAKWDMS